MQVLVQIILNRFPFQIRLASTGRKPLLLGFHLFLLLLLSFGNFEITILLKSSLDLVSDLEVHKLDYFLGIA